MGDRVKVALLSCGLGHVTRGFEVSTARWYEALKQHDELDVKLYAGGKYPDTHWIWNLNRDGVLNIPLRHFPFLPGKKRWEFSYGAEQVSFGCSFIVEQFRFDPDIVWTKEAPLAHVIDFWRKLLNLKFKIVFANGGAFKPKTIQQFDFLQHLQPASMDAARAFGIPEEKMCVIPNVVQPLPPSMVRTGLRGKYGLHADDFVVVSVAAWNQYHKRIDYIIEEVSRLSDPRIKLLLCGQPETETPPLKELAARLLPGRVTWLTVPPAEVFDVLHASDLFVLASLHEGLGMVVIEAAMSGLPVICHPHGGSQYIVNNDEYWLRDLRNAGALAESITQVRERGVDPRRLAQLRRQANERFGEKALVGQFHAMVKRMLAEKLKVPRERQLYN
jgi:glycosyltransferase involved in cell wall biosynthesis